MRTTAFVPFWSKGKDSFLSDPPNADISILEGDQLRQIVAVLQDPALQGGNLTYTVKVLQGEMRARGADVRRRAQSAMGFARENQVRTGLRAGGRRIRTIGSSCKKRVVLVETQRLLKGAAGSLSGQPPLGPPGSFPPIAV
jgi:hypothetical protein